ncbi:sigma-70 family RNA polymerase sigma factor [Clostridium hydrogeniformans]|uniref:sigma-70 family RNA polymerase sigma factor n=1 Tax=Clostridium hydrogeniformans TaxID=349933 RepID=UPI000A76011B|nr:sigma-70 family RNA polymerase sigma factor [Clostridium hydrogeniformans]
MDKLVEEAKRGDKKAFIDLIRGVRGDLYKVAKGFLSCEEDIKDVISETIVIAYEKVGTLRNNEYFKTWITRILINKCNLILKEKKKITYLSDIKEISYPQDFRNIDLYRAVDNLSEEIKMVIVLYYFGDYPVDKISEVLDIKEGTVKSRLFRGRKKLFEVLREGEEKSYVK